ncbi:GntG family PLP-dependent aldolase [Actinoplanes sp. NBRC 103695]|uniref:threonine aldolase family protein n=1 Tax=Actinoplanes sp. NBRC 103695 TaxID=3032202 RepID=UPI0024A2F6E9|nr:GntG family PLP-dependent aldolase [Actinoplanes sp. NBRC 103695]GLY93398.1 threonine aldolase [Actinoplanes sp. NBRC 103695]
MADFRSDTVTRPTAEMRAAMAAAPVGDDVFGDDPTVNALEAQVAAMFGHEAALFCPSGTMANQIAMQLLVPPGGELLAGADAHVLTYELGAAAVLGGVSTRTWGSVGAGLDADEIAAMVRPDGYPSNPTRAIAVEQTHNLAGGTIIPLETLTALRARTDVALHCDGARIWHAHVATDTPLDAYGRLFDTLSVCLSKGLGAPVGSLVVGSAERITRARVLRKRMGGGMRQVGILAAAGQYALTHHLKRLADDHGRAKRLAEGLPHTRATQTNIVLIDLSETRWDAPGLVAAAAGKDVHIVPMLPKIARLITHLDVTDDDVDLAIDVLSELLAT